LALLLVSALLVACGGKPEAEAARPAMVVQAGAAQVSVEAYSGDVRAREEMPLAFRVGGKISRRLVDAGAKVKAGQALAELDASDLKLQSEAYRAQLAQAEADMALAKAELDRHQGLLDRQLVSRSLYDTRLAQFRAAEARVRQARAQASVYGNQAGYAVLRATRDGVVAQRLAEAGQVVAAGQAVFVLAVDGGREVGISIPEQHIGEFKLGRGLLVELWTAPGRRFPGKLREIAPSADALTRTYAARVAFELPADVAVELGQSARVYAPGEQKASMSLPLSALHQRDGKPAVWVVDAATSKVHLKLVQVGPYTETGVPVVAGIAPDDWVVAAGGHLLLEGEKVLPIDSSNRPVPLAAKPAAQG
jgi:multidrug efflux system membrane fusion protein